jgi:homoserine kinase type II
MSVFTTVTETQLKPWLAQYPLGELISLKGIAAGVTNTNYFVTTSTGKYVLTLFETLKAEELPFYVNLMVHLAKHGVAVATPIARHDGAYIDTLSDKPTAIMTCLPGSVNEHPDPTACMKMGEMLARMHMYGANFPEHMPNPRGPLWIEKTAEKLYLHLSDDDRQLLQDEITATYDRSTLPQGVIHADLFRDNVLMNGEEIGGLIDFYYACNDALLFDVAVTVNDWCMNAENSALDPEKIEAFLNAYEKVRPFTAEEKSAWPMLLRAAALRFWVSRLLDLHFPPAGELTYTKDPTPFKVLLTQHQLPMTL